jgi:hypothetical protein
MPTFRQFLRRFLIIVGVIVVIAVALRLIWDIPSAATLAILLIGWPLGGTMITIDDDLPGGWSNPDGKAIPEWKMLWWWADLLLVRGAIVVTALFIEDAIAGHFTPGFLVAALAMMGLGLPLFLRGVKREIADANAV